ncbi:isochorismatase family protein [Niveispirillum sp. KHB5.9]|uniref:isochorismatase family protein n=1 Tax=Niveispirillum sp. KHB5.9 TaxID=3400269 RepID=UPI003A8951CD
MHAITPLPDWALKRSRTTFRFDSIDPARAALLVIDLQESFLASGRRAALLYGLPIIPNVNRLIEAARDAGMKVIFLRQTFTWDGAATDLAPWQQQAAPPVIAARRTMTAGHPGHEVYGGLDHRPGDLVIDKYRQSAFIHGSSDLQTHLRALGIDSLVITGALSNACCESTSRDAYALGYRVYFIADATAAMSDEEQNATLLNVAVTSGAVIDTDTMLAMLDAHRGRP